ncbi:unnamed protein product [Penicillium pancosmium]
MPSLLSLPLEIQCMIINLFDYASEFNNYGQTCRAINSVADQRLYQHFAQLYSPRGFKRVIENDNMLAVRRLLSAGVGFYRYDRVYRDHHTPFELAVSRGNEDVIYAFVDILGSENTMSDIYGGAGVLGAAMKHGGTMSRPREHNLALMKETDKADFETVQLLLAAGADPNATDNLYEDYPDYKHRMPLLIAAKTKNEEMVRLLLQNGAHLLLSKDINACQIAEICAAGAEDMARLILENIDIDAKLNTLDDEQLYLFFNYAATIGDENLTERLLRMGCSAEAVGTFYGDALLEGWHRFSSPIALCCETWEYENY